MDGKRRLQIIGSAICRESKQRRRATETQKNRGNVAEEHFIHRRSYWTESGVSTLLFNLILYRVKHDTHSDGSLTR